ncbi:MAG: DNA repair protein RadA [Lachnospiraceae bacterium]|nr:DNA repair protein RadA [Lachnospiraceae bacterium]
MAKAKDTVFFCKECGYESAKWAGQCPACHEWNTFVEAPAEQTVKAAVRKVASIPSDGEKKQVPLADVTATEDERILTHIEEFDRVLGGGIIKGSLVLVGGDPGIGKSTLLTQVCKALSDDGHKVLYITGEESLGQIKLRADRIGSFTENLLVMAETDLDAIEAALSEERPEVAVIDSIQTMYRPDVTGAPGSLGQVRECTALFMQLAKGLSISIFVVGHVTKEGVVAGPRTLEHMVDTVLYFEGEAQGTYRILRGVKNRFGSTNEIGVFEMRSDGLNEVRNPSEFMLMGRPENASGSIVSCSIEGTRPILLEIQALVARTGLGNPRRSSTGIDYNRMNLLIAVLEKRLGFQLSECDAYVNIVGGVRINETALDLAVLIAIASSYLDIIVDAGTIALGEVGLSGEVRNVSMIEARVNEAKKLGFQRCILPKSALKTLQAIDGVELIGVTDVKEAIDRVRGK